MFICIRNILLLITQSAFCMRNSLCEKGRKTGGEGGRGGSDGDKKWFISTSAMLYCKIWRYQKNLYDLFLMICFKAHLYVYVHAVESNLSPGLRIYNLLGKIFRTGVPLPYY